MYGMNGKSAKISGPQPLPSTFFSLLHSTIRCFIIWTNEERRNGSWLFRRPKLTLSCSAKGEEGSVIFCQKMEVVTWMPEPPYWMAGQSKEWWQNSVYIFLGPFLCVCVCARKPILCIMVYIIANRTQVMYLLFLLIGCIGYTSSSVQVYIFDFELVWSKGQLAELH
jgi:hypothetical protein